MGLLDDFASAADSVFVGAEHAVGHVVDDVAHVAGDALHAVGLDGAAQAVDDWGDNVASDLGDAVAEKQLGQTTDPTQLIHGDVGALTATVGHLRKFAAAFGQTAQGLSGVDTSAWVGGAADAFRATYEPHTKLWSDAQQACGNAATALSSYTDTVKWAQGQAQRAIALYAQGVRATQQAQAEYNQRVDAYNSAAKAYNAALSAGQNPGTAPTQPAAFTDPGAADRQQAQELLERARAQRDSAAAEAQSAVSAATNLAPATPSSLDQIGDDIGDIVGGAQTGLAHFAGGVIKGVAGIADFARGLNPLDPYNITHPAEYVDGLSTTAAGLVHMSLHPTQVVPALLGSGWGSDPFEALGKLVPNVALAVASDGAGTAADVATDVGERAAVGAGEDAAEGAAGSAARDAAGDPVETTRDPGSTPCKDDPVDVATGQVLLPQVDVELAGVLPLVLERTHLSGFRLGGWFGRTWASTLDQRLHVDDDGVIYIGADGVRLFYPHPGVDAPVLPEEGARWPLCRTADGSYAITRADTGQTLRFPRAFGAGRWPLGTISDRAGTCIQFRYTSAGVPREIVHDGGYRLRLDVEGERVTAVHLVGAGEDGADIEMVRYGYTGGQLTEITNSSGQPLRLSYDQAGRLTEWVDRNGVRYGYVYDEAGRCVHTQGPDGALSGSFVYDSEHRVTTHTDVAGAVTRYEYDERLRVIAETDPLGQVTRSEYDRYGWLVARTDPLGRTTRYRYDESGNPTAVTRPDASQMLTEYAADGLPTVVVYPDGAVWRYDYDQRGNPTAVTDPVGAVTRYAYDERGHLTAITDALGATTRVRTNPVGLPIEVIDPAGGVTRYVRDGFGRVVEHIDPIGGVTRFAWTAEGKLATRTTPDGVTERWSYDGEGNPVDHVDALGQVTRTEYTHFDLPTARTTPDGARLEYAYDHQLRLVSVTNPQGLVWRYTYDPAGRLRSETDFSGHTTHYTHDAAGQVVARTNGAGQTLAYRYDLLGNVVEQHSGDEVTRYAYDPAGRLIRATDSDADLVLWRDPCGRVVAEVVNGRTLTSGYDLVGRRVRRVTPAGVDSRWDYDVAGRPTALHTSGHTMTFGHDMAGREVERRLDAAFALTQTWDDAHRLASQTVVGDEFGPRRQARAAAAMVLQRRHYTYRPDGHLTNVEDQLSGGRRFDLDAAGRITAVHGVGWTESYAYDPAGNITHAAWPVVDHRAPDVPDRDPLGGRDYTGTLITRAGTIRYQHDNAGRVVVRRRKRLSSKDWVWRYHWDAADRLDGVITPDGTHWRYRYDPLDRRIAKQRLAADAATVVEQIDFTWDGDHVVEQARNGTQVTTWDYAPGEHRPLTQRERTIPPDAGQTWFDERFYAIVTDLVGTPTELIDAHGGLAWHARTTIWGTPLAPSTESMSTPLRFPGQYFDPETGLHYNRHRYYDPLTARYTTPDPLGLAPAPNPHSYVHNPTTWLDPLGLMGCVKDGHIPLYRAVQQNELADILANRSFSNPAGIETKYFAQSAEDAAAYGRQAYMNWPHEGPYTIVRTSIDPALIPEGSTLPYVADVSGGLAGVALPTSLLPELGRPRVLPYSPIGGIR